VRIGFLGGSFDPVHYGHLIAAQDAFEQHKLDRVVFVPAAQAPLKPTETRTSAEDRLAMVEAAIAGDTRFAVSDFELKEGGVSYTIDSAKHFRARFPNDDLFWIMGGDQLPNLHLWREIEALAQIVSFIFLERPGYPVKAEPQILGLKLLRCDGHLVEVSSTELRQRAARGLSLDYFVPRNAVRYIQQRGLYR
jgi:nicotinate-nucleotide adenylyltransferase